MDMSLSKKKGANLLTALKVAFAESDHTQ